MPHSANNSTSSTAHNKMSRPSSTSTSSGNLFPKQATATVLSPEKVGEQLSPALSSFSFASSPHSVQEVDHDDISHRRPSGRRLTAAGIGALAPRSPRSPRSRTQFFEDSFAYKDTIPSSARERITGDAPIVAELRTNVIIKDEYTLVTDLSHHLSARYQRPETSIMITVNHSACLLLGGTFEPTYFLTINALPVQLQPTTNKRNAAMIQAFMTESIGVTPDRGIIKFAAIPEESLAMNGMTVLGDIEQLERQQAEESGGNMKRAITKASRKSGIYKAKSGLQLNHRQSRMDSIIPAVFSPLSSPVTAEGPLDSGVAINEKTGEEPAASSSQPSGPINRKNSEPILSNANNTKNSEPILSNANKRPVPPPIPIENPSFTGVGKRKSFMSVFRRAA